MRLNRKIPILAKRVSHVDEYKADKSYVCRLCTFNRACIIYVLYSSQKSLPRARKTPVAGEGAKATSQTLNPDTIPDRDSAVRSPTSPTAMVSMWAPDVARPGVFLTRSWPQLIKQNIRMILTIKLRILQCRVTHMIHLSILRGRAARNITSMKALWLQVVRKPCYATRYRTHMSNAPLCVCEQVRDEQKQMETKKKKSVSKHNERQAFIKKQQQEKNERAKHPKKNLREVSQAPGFICFLDVCVCHKASCPFFTPFCTFCLSACDRWCQKHGVPSRQGQNVYIHTWTKMESKPRFVETATRKRMAMRHPVSTCFYCCCRSLAVWWTLALRYRVDPVYNRALNMHIECVVP